MTRPPTDIAASVKQKLLNIARERGEDFNTLLVRYGVERFLYRLSKSKHSSSMILKGAMVFVLWRPTPHRPTRDLDLLGFGDASPDAVTQRVREILEVPVQNDGLVFDAASVAAGRIREDQTYEGVRVTLKAMLGKAVIDLQVDVAFGDAVSGSYEKAKYPTLLDFPAPHVRAYARETVIAEKVQSMVELGLANSRMKDFYDILVLSKEFQFDSAGLASAIRVTFDRRNTPMPSELPFALTEEFGTDNNKQSQWRAFLRRLSLGDVPPEFAKVIGALRAFLTLPLGISESTQRSKSMWPPGGPWR